MSMLMFKTKIAHLLMKDNGTEKKKQRAVSKLPHNEIK